RIRLLGVGGAHRGDRNQGKRPDDCMNDADHGTSLGCEPQANVRLAELLPPCAVADLDRNLAEMGARARLTCDRWDRSPSGARPSRSRPTSFLASAAATVGN